MANRRCNDIPEELKSWWTNSADPTQIKHDQIVSWWKPVDYTGGMFRKVPNGSHFDQTKEQVVHQWNKEQLRLAKLQAQRTDPVVTQHPAPASQTITHLDSAVKPLPESILKLAASTAGLLGPRVGTNIYNVLCPWRALHTAGRQTQQIHDQSTQITFDAFHCRHKSCLGKIAQDFLAEVSPQQPVLEQQVILVFDRSGSMRRCMTEAKKQIDLVVSKLKEHPTWDIRLLWLGYGVAEGFAGKAKFLSDNYVYSPSEGATYLYSAIKKAAYYAIASTQPTLVYIITDGQPEGDTLSPIHARLQAEQALSTDRVTFICVGPEAAVAFFKSCSIPDGCIRKWDGLSSVDLSVVSQQVQSGLQDYIQARQAGATAVKKFFVDARKLDAGFDKLVDITRTCKVLRVTHEQPLQPFVEDNKQKFVVGANYYPLTKREKLPKDRAILVRKKGNSQIFSGPDIRGILGLPNDREVIVEPGDMGLYELFMASNSHNRLLVTGTDLIIRLDAQEQTHTWVK